jgi:hypothetical protein
MWHFVFMLWPPPLAARRTPRAAALGAASEEAGDLDSAVLHYAAAAEAAQGDEAGLAHSALGATLQQLAMADGHFDQVSAWKGASLQREEPPFSPAGTVLLACTRGFEWLVGIVRAHIRVHRRQLLLSLRHQPSTINRQPLASTIRNRQLPTVKPSAAYHQHQQPTANCQPPHHSTIDPAHQRSRSSLLCGGRLQFAIESDGLFKISSDCPS